MKRRRVLVFAPSSGGCITCRQRKIRCDQTQPLCQNCTKSGKICLGYRNPSVAFDIEHGATSQIVRRPPPAGLTPAWLRSSNTSQPWNIAKAPPPRYASLHFKEAERQGFEYFTHVFSDALVRVTPGIASIPVVLALSRDRDLLFHAAGLIGTAFQASTKAMHTSLAAATTPAIKANLTRQYSRTFAGLHDLINNANTDETLETILITCLFLSILELVRGNNVQTLRHLSFGRVIFMEHYPRTLGLAVPDAQRLVGSPLIQLLIGTFFPFGVHPSMSKPTLAIGPTIPKFYQFGSIADATSDLNALQESHSHFLADLMDLAEEYRCSMAPATKMLGDGKQFCLTQCVSRMSSLPMSQRISDRLYKLRQSHEEWIKAYETFRIDNTPVQTAELLLLKIRWYTSHLQLQMCRDSSEMSIERFNSDFLQLLNLLEIYLTAWKQQSRNGPIDPRIPNHITNTRHPEFGALQALITVCFKCRDSTIRHKALRMLMTVKRQESLHDSDALAPLVKSVIKLEEELAGVEWKFGSLNTSETPSPSIPEFARFSEVVFDRARTDGAYKVFCARHRLEHDGAIELLEFDYWDDEALIRGMRYDQSDQIDAEIERSVKAGTLLLCSCESFPSLVDLSCKAETDF